MIDIHCHILPDVDDGAVNLAESIKMAKIAQADGIAKIVATPHINGHSTDRPFCLSTNRQFFATGQGLLIHYFKKLSIAVDILLGGEVAVHPDLPEINLHTLNGTQYILIELPADHLPKNTADILFNLILKGLHPIIAHPERNRTILEAPDKLLNLLNPQVLLQITAGSITGRFGPDSRACARFLLRKNLVSFIASDAHNAGDRRPVLSKGVAAAAKIIGKNKALKLVTENPAAMLAGEPIRRDPSSVF
jgi:protein-tyrosine phosphatase